jgi:hypothetical protein
MDKPLTTVERILTAKPPKKADARDLAEMCECQQRARATYDGEGICRCIRGAPPSVPDDFVLTDETWIAELEPFWLPTGICNSLEKHAKIFTVGELRRWLAGGERVPQIDGRQRGKIEAAIAAAERWGK